MRKQALGLALISFLIAGKSEAQSGVKDSLFFVGVTAKNPAGFSLLQMVKSDTFSKITSVVGKKDPNFLAVSPDGQKLYVACSEAFTADDKAGTVEAYAIGEKGMLTFLNSQSSKGRGPAHISVDPKGRYVYVANYSAGNFSVFPIMADGRLDTASTTIAFTGSGFNAELQRHPFAHSVSPSADGKFIYVSTLGLDKINIYRVGKKGKVKPAKSPFASSTPGAGPRMLAFSPDGTLAFSAEEITASVASYRVNKKTGALTPLDRQILVPGGQMTPAMSGSDVHVSPDSRFVYASIRGLNQMAVYSLDITTGKMDLVQREDVHGNNPRIFCLDRSARHLLIGNMLSDNLTLFSRDPSSGRITFVSSTAIVSPECIITR